MASAASVPKFYKSVIDDVIQSMREIFLDDGIDEQVIQEFKQTWERKVLDSRAVEHALQQQQVSTTTSSSNPNAQTVTSTNSNASSSSSKSEKSAGKASTLSSSTTNSAGQQQSQPVHTTSVITSNPNHQTSNQTKNSKNSTNNSKNLTEPNKTKSEMTKNPVMGNHHSKTISNAPSIAIHATNSNIVQNAMTQNIMLTNPQQQIRPSTTTLTSIHSQPEQLFRTSAIVPNNSISLAAAPGTNATVLQVSKRNFQQSQQPQNFNVNDSTIYNSNKTLMPNGSVSCGGSNSFANIDSLATSHTNNNNLKRTRDLHEKETLFNNFRSSYSNSDVMSLSANNDSFKDRITNCNKSFDSQELRNNSSSDNQMNMIKSESIGIIGNNDSTQSLPMNLSTNSNFAQHQPQQQRHFINSILKSHPINQNNVKKSKMIRQSNPTPSSSQAQNYQTFTNSIGINRFQMINNAVMGNLGPTNPSQSLIFSNNPNNRVNQTANISGGGGGTGTIGSGSFAVTNHKEVKFAPSMIQGGPKVVLLPNNLMASNATPGQLVIHPEFLNLPHNSVIAGGQQVFPAAGIQYIQGPPGSAGQTSVLAAPLHQVRPIAANLTAVQQTSQPNGPVSRVAQLDGHHDSNDSSDEEDEDDEFNDNDDDIEDNDDEINDEENETGVEEEPLNSEDDVSDEDPVELFETDNVVVCQYDKITRSRNKWKFHFKDGIMNLQGKDYVFSRAVGDAEW
ncbi:Transcription initiation factor IIA subunit 1 [Sarcoptes scabiei]|nr:Transcription initiation factor IIA subunit 1 [Sarcoptes scabiei]